MTRHIATLCFSDLVNAPICSLMFDEVYIKPSIRYTGGHVIGYSLDNPTELARTMLVFMIKIMFTQKESTVLLRLIPVYNLRAEFLLEHILSFLKTIHESGGKVISLICDSLSTNKKLFKLLRERFPSNSSFKIPHPLNMNDPLYLLFDSIHLLKGIRNNWYTEKSQKILFKPPNSNEIVTADWLDPEYIYNLEKHNPVKRSTLSYASVHPSVFERQKVSLVCKIFNDKTVAVLAQERKQETACFVFHVNRLWKVLNNKSLTAHLHLNDEVRTPIRINNNIGLKIISDISDSFKQMIPGRGKFWMQKKNWMHEKRAEGKFCKRKKL